ncbi:ATP-grasp fold amidoligase family protein [Halomonas sp. C05BenzN]|uniref:ATP-grasp fold amidoligase family protein n=1 Tax=Halomonas sp. C05BenzN TaxID=3411041 RepID=UPI003B959C89
MYKTLIPFRSVRKKILNALDFIPDPVMLHCQYFMKFYRPMSLDNPVRFSEKLQWYKLNYRVDLMTQCVDKVSVREFVADRGLASHLIPVHAVYDTPDDIDLDSLPNKFALKFSNGAKWNIICHDKSRLDWPHAMKEIRSWFREPVGRLGREWSYYGVRPRLLVESLLESEGGQVPEDYKFFCFNGKTSFLYVIQGRFSEDGIRLGVYDSNFRRMNVSRRGIRPLEEAERPKHFEEMVEIANRLSHGFPHVRVDLYNVSGKIYFGELTFYSASGYAAFEPDSFDRDVGRLFTLPDQSA